MIQNSGMAKLSYNWCNMKNLQYLMDSTCTITALIIWHLSYHSQAGIWQHLCVHTGKHSTWNIHNISKFEWQLIEMFFRIWELTHYAYCRKISWGKRSQFSKFADIGGNFGSQKEKIQKLKYTYWYYMFFLLICKLDIFSIKGFTIHSTCIMP